MAVSLIDHTHVISRLLALLLYLQLTIYHSTNAVADPEFSKGGFQNSEREARGEKFVRSRPLPVQTGGKNEGLKN